MGGPAQIEGSRHTQEAHPRREAPAQTGGPQLKREALGLEGSLQPRRTVSSPDGTQTKGPQPKRSFLCPDGKFSARTGTSGTECVTDHEYLPTKSVDKGMYRVIINE